MHPQRGSGRPGFLLSTHSPAWLTAGSAEGISFELMKTACSCHKIFQQSLQPHTPQACGRVQILFYFLYVNAQSSDIYRIIHLLPLLMMCALPCCTFGWWMSYMENCRNSFKPGVFIISLWRRFPTFLAGNRGTQSPGSPSSCLGDWVVRSWALVPGTAHLFLCSQVLGEDGGPCHSVNFRFSLTCESVCVRCGLFYWLISCPCVSITPL